MKNYKITFDVYPANTEVFISDDDYDYSCYHISHDGDDAIAYEDEDGIIDANSIKEWAINIADKIKDNFCDELSGENYTEIAEKFETVLDKFRND